MTEALYAFLAVLGGGLAAWAAEWSWVRLRARQASRRARIADIEASYERDTRR